MKPALLLQYLDLLFRNPKEAWATIDREYVGSTWDLIRNYFLVFFLLLPVSIGIKQVFVFKSFTLLIYQGILTPWVILGAYLVVLYLLSIVTEEAARFLKAKVVPYSGTKLAFFSALPFVACAVFVTIPYLGVFILLTGFAYQMILILFGAEYFFGLSGSRKWLWFISVFVSFILLAMLLFISATLLIFLLNLI